MSEDALFGRTEYVGGYAGGTEQEYDQLPVPVTPEAEAPTIIFSLESPEDREQLIQLLGVPVERNQWSCWWPTPPDDGTISLEL